MANLRQRALQTRIDLRESLLLKSLTDTQKATRHKCFVSFHQEDETETATFVDNFQDVFIPRVLGVSDEDDFIHSNDTNYVMEQIRERYLTDSTVTIVLVGKCTWARRYVDWEVYSTLRNDKNNKRSGLVAITLPSVASYDGRTLPARVDDNVGKDGVLKYARWLKYPSSSAVLKSVIQEAFDARTTRADQIDNTRPRRHNNSPCS